MKTQEKKLAQAKEDLLKIDPYDYQALGEAQAGIHELEQRIEALEEEWLLVAESNGRLACCVPTVGNAVFFSRDWACGRVVFSVIRPMNGRLRAWLA